MQAPFASLFIYFSEAEPGQDREDLVLVTKEILKQRIKGIKNKAGTWVAPTFPKILYVLDETNCKEGTLYWEVTKLAAECTAKRMVPDYISEKKMKEYKEGNVFGCMGAVVGNSVVKYKINDVEYQTSIAEMYKSIIDKYNVDEEDQFGQKDNPNKDLNLKKMNIQIFDNNKKDFVKCLMMNKNLASQFKLYELSFIQANAPVCITKKECSLIMTHDHPLMISTTQNIDDAKEIQCVDLLKNLSSDPLENARYVFVYDENTKSNEPYFINSIREIATNDEFVYDVTTETGHFMVNNIYSHNCRSFLSVWKDPETNKPKFWGRLTKLEVKPTLNCVNA